MAYVKVLVDKRVSWDKEQEEFVKQNYNGSGSQLSNILPFTASSIRNKAKRLGVRNNGHFHNVEKAILPEISEADKNYIGGFFDGEGSLYRHQKGWRIMVGNSDEPVIRWMQALFGGMGRFDIFQPRKHQHKLAYVWRINRQGEVWAFLEMFLPYLKIKNRLALVAIEEFEHKFKILQ